MGREECSTGCTSPRLWVSPDEMLFLSPSSSTSPSSSPQKAVAMTALGWLLASHWARPVVAAESSVCRASRAATTVCWSR